MSIHSAPPVVYPLGRSRFQACVLWLGWLMGLLLMVCWCAAQQQPDWRLAGGSLALVIAGWAALTSYRNLPVGQLMWDGQEWRWESAGYQTGTAGHTLSVIADFQHVLVLRLKNQAGARLWLCAERSAMEERWLDLRRAAYFRVPSAGASGFQSDEGLLNTVGTPHVAVSAHAHRDFLSKP